MVTSMNILRLDRNKNLRYRCFWNCGYGTVCKNFVGFRALILTISESCVFWGIASRCGHFWHWNAVEICCVYFVDKITAAMMAIGSSIRCENFGGWFCYRMSPSLLQHCSKVCSCQVKRFVVVLKGERRETIIRNRWRWTAWWLPECKSSANEMKKMEKAEKAKRTMMCLW